LLESFTLWRAFVDNLNEFNPQSMVEWARDMAENSAGRLAQEERLIAIRSVVSAFLENGVIDEANLEEEGSTFTAAAQTLYMCQLIPAIFADAYAEIEIVLTDQEKAELAREEAIQSLKRSFEL